MIANFQPQSRRSPAFAALVAAVALVTLTDARATERIKRHIMPLSPEAEASMARLDVPLTFELTSASIETVLHTVSNRTGMLFHIAEGALDDAARATRITVKATDAPAHSVVTESLASLGLAVRFTPEGATIEKAPNGVRVIRVDVPAGGSHEKIVHVPAAGPNVEVVDLAAPGANAEIRVLHSGVHARGDEADVVISAPRPVDTAEVHAMTHRKIEVSRSAGNGVARTRLTFRGGKEGQPEGTLELEVQRAESSTTR